MKELADGLKVLGDETRLRTLRLLMEEPLNVGEVTRILGVAQPTASKHLGELRRIGLVESQRRAGYTYYAISERTGKLWDSIAPLLGDGGAGKGDLARLAEILRQREEFSEADRFVVPGRSWVVWSRALRFLLPDLTVADFGCGDGAFTVEIARWARWVFAVDSNPAFLKLAREAASGFSNIEFLEEDMHQVTLGAECVQLVVISQSLHYAQHPAGVIGEAHRILASGGRILLIELFPHNEDWVTSELGHGWLGFDPIQVEEWMRDSGFQEVETDAHFKRAYDTFQPFITTARK